MKKAYIRPESKLFAINFTENIAMQSGTADGGRIRWETIVGHPGRYYSGCELAPVLDPEPNFEEYKRCENAILALQSFSEYVKYHNCGTS